MLQDAGMKLYGGGDHDLEGLGFCNLLLLIGAPLSLVLLIGALGRNRTIATRHKAGAIGLFVALLVGHLLLFGSLGVGLYVAPTSNEAKAMISKALFFYTWGHGRASTQVVP